MAQREFDALRRDPAGRELLAEFRRMFDGLKRQLSIGDEGAGQAMADLQTEVRARLSKRGLEDALTISDPARRAAAIRRAMRDLPAVQAEVAAEFSRRMARTTAGAMRVQDAFLRATLARHVTGARFDTNRVDQIAVREARRAGTLIKDVSRDYVNGVRKVMVASATAERGLSTEELEARVSAIEERRLAGELPADEFPSAEKWASMAASAEGRARLIVRTETMRINNEAYQEKAKDLLAGEDIRWLWVNPNDLRTSPTHRQRIGMALTEKEWQNFKTTTGVKKKYVESGFPPLRPACRCMVLAVTAEMFDDATWEEITSMRRAA